MDFNKTSFMNRRRRKEVTKPHLPFLSHLVQGKIAVWDALTGVFHDHLTTSQSGLRPRSTACERSCSFISSFMYSIIYPQTFIKYLPCARHWARNRAMVIGVMAPSFAGLLSVLGVGVQTRNCYHALLHSRTGNML